MSTVLSTKILTAAQKELLLHAGLGVVAHNFIQTVALEMDAKIRFKNMIFTSQNAVHYFFNTKNTCIENPTEISTFCVGSKTKAALEKKGVKVIEKAENASDLAKKLSKRYKNDQFSFICGKQRRDELPDMLTSNAIVFEEYHVYDTLLNPITIPRSFDGLLFYSPSAVKSYTSANPIGLQTCFCIGSTTASEASKHTTNTILATTPTIENVIVQAVKHLKL